MFLDKSIFGFFFLSFFKKQKNKKPRALLAGWK